MDAPDLPPRPDLNDRVKWPEVLVRKLRAPQATVRVLVDPGLPRAVSYHLTFDAPGDRVPREPGHPDRVRLGQDTDVPIYLDEARNGEVWIDTGGPGADARRFMNSSVERMTVFLVLYDRLASRYLETEEAGWSALAEEYRSRMRAEDAVALEGEDRYWAVVLEMVAAGML